MQQATARVVIGVGNLCKEKPGDAEMIQWLTTETKHLARTKGAHALLALTEFGRGKKSVRVRVLGKVEEYFTKQRWITIDPKAAHGAIAVRSTKMRGRDGKTFRTHFVTMHGTHKRTVGRVRQMAYYTALAARLAGWTAKGHEWVVSGDANGSIKTVARLLRGSGVGHGVDGTIVSRRLRVSLLKVADRPRTKGWSDHPAVFTLVTVR